MARMRMLKPGFFTNDTLAELKPLTRLLFQGLWCLADRSGRLEDRPRKIKAEILPFDNANVNRMLDDLATAGFITRYESNGSRFIQVVTFTKHQSPNVREPASTIPAPDEHSTGTVHALHLTGTEQNSDSTVRDTVPEASSGSLSEDEDPEPQTLSKPLPNPKRTKPDEAWAEQMRETYGSRLKDFDESLMFYMNTGWYSKAPDKCAYLEGKLKAAAERSTGSNAMGARSTNQREVLVDDVPYFLQPEYAAKVAAERAAEEAAAQQ
jgi:hypothetical protein